MLPPVSEDLPLDPACRRCCRHLDVVIKHTDTSVQCMVQQVRQQVLDMKTDYIWQGGSNLVARFCPHHCMTHTAVCLDAVPPPAPQSSKPWRLWLLIKMGSSDKKSRRFYQYNWLKFHTAAQCFLFVINLQPGSNHSLIAMCEFEVCVAITWLWQMGLMILLQFAGISIKHVFPFLFDSCKQLLHFLRNPRHSPYNAKQTTGVFCDICL